ncbi:MAG: molecular chaperone HtpG [Planctomycetota bacterium]
MEFQAETRQLLDLMIHSLYQHKEIFLRELISNASDALDKVHFLSLTDSSLLEGEEKLSIRIDVDPKKKLLFVSDSGIGMNRDDLVANLGTIARSGTQEFLKALEKAKGEAGDLPEMIGQFGVGFYSSFMVADEVVVETRKAGESQGYRWSSRADGSYTIEEMDREQRGTTVKLHLKKKGLDEQDFADYASEYAIRSVVKKYSDFVTYPIEMEVEREEGEGDAKRKVLKIEVLNSMKPLWTRSPSEVTDDEHSEFYRHLTHDWEVPAARVHFRAEGALEYDALLYVPSHPPLSLFEPQQHKSRIALYVKRVFIMADCEELLPPWLRFTKGLVDSSDMPLNVSRETLQHARQIVPIRKKLTSKILEKFKKMMEDDREAYEGIWKNFGPVLKEGIYFEEEADKFRVAEIALFQSTRGGGLISLDEYIEKMPFKQKEIYFIAGQDRKSLEASPHLEAFRKNGYEVLLLTDPVDEFAMSRLTEFDNHKIKSVERGQIDLEDEKEKKKRESQEKEQKPLLEAVKKSLGDRVGEVRFSNRLTESAAVLVSGEKDLTPHMKRVLREARQEVPDTVRTLELNPEHALIQKLTSLQENESRFDDFCQLLYCQALLAEGSPIEDPARFNRLVSDLMVSTD